MKKSNALGINSSLRSCSKNIAIKSAIKSARSFSNITQYIYKSGGDKKISNSEALLLASLYGAKETGAEIDVLNLRDHFPLFNHEPISPSVLLDKIDRCKALLLSSPVYFGERSSLIADLIAFLKQSANDSPLILDGKGVGIVSVGAKRNGGQETTNIYTLSDCLDLGACVVGNGPPESQYGGTGWGGALGGIIDDHFGLKTSKGTGHRVGLLCKLFNIPTKPIKIRILVIITRNERHNKFFEWLSDLPFSSYVDLDIIDISKLKIKRCLACRVCPNGKLDKDYKCFIRSTAKSGKDDMQLIHKHIAKADGVILAQYHGRNAGPDKYQVFMERTRFIRRNDYELSDLAFSNISITNLLTDISSIRAMTSFLRHNMIVVGPFYKGLQNDSEFAYLENILIETYTNRYEAVAQKIALARNLKFNNISREYKPIGYPEYYTN